MNINYEKNKQIRMKDKTNRFNLLQGKQLPLIYFTNFHNCFFYLEISTVLRLLIGSTHLLSLESQFEFKIGLSWNDWVKQSDSLILNFEIGPGRRAVLKIFCPKTSNSHGAK